MTYVLHAESFSFESKFGHSQISTFDNPKGMVPNKRPLLEPPSDRLHAMTCSGKRLQTQRRALSGQLQEANEAPDLSKRS